MEPVRPYVRRKFGMLQDYNTETIRTELNSIPTELFTKDSLQNVVKYSRFISNLSISIYFIHVILYLEFKGELADALAYFFAIQGLCLLLSLFDYSLNLFRNGLRYITLTNVLEAFAIAIALVVLLIEIFDEEMRSRVLVKVASVLRFYRLFRLLDLTVPFNTKKSFTVAPYKNNSERLLNILRSLREMSWISENPQIDAGLEWGIRVICNQTLYNLRVYSENEDQEEIIKWAISDNSAYVSPKMAKSLTAQPKELDYSPEIKVALKKIDKISFDACKLKEATSNNELFVISIYLFDNLDLFSLERIDKDNFKNFIQKLQSGYDPKVPYHNSTHAADVMQCFHYLLNTCGGKEFNKLTSTEISICLLSSAIHDFQHPGVNNIFLIHTKHELSTLYNDKSVLENHHIAAAFKIVSEPSSNIFSKMSEEVVNYYRNLMIELVLATDFSKHFRHLAKFKLMYGEDVEGKRDKRLMMRMMMHASDISNPCRTWEVYFDLATRVLEEFFLQGDREKELGLVVSPLCDRETTTFCKSQAGFIKMFVAPVFDALSEAMPGCWKCTRNIAANKDKIDKLALEKDNDGKPTTNE